MKKMRLITQVHPTCQSNSQKNQSVPPSLRGRQETTRSFYLFLDGLLFRSHSKDQINNSGLNPQLTGTQRHSVHLMEIVHCTETSLRERTKRENGNLFLF